MAKKPPDPPPKTGKTRKPRRPNNWRQLFLESLADAGIVSVACKAACVDKSTARDHRNKDAAFATAWDEAIESATDEMVAEARRRAVKGVNEPVYYQGKRVGAVRRYSDVLLMFLIKKERPAYRDGRPEPGQAGDPRPRLNIPGADGRP